MKKILVLTAEKDAEKRRQIEENAGRIFGKDITAELIGDAKEVTYDRLRQYGCLLSLDEEWSRQTGADGAAALISYVAGGGGLVGLHGGIALDGRYGLSHLVGAVKTGQGEKKVRTFRRHGSTDHAIMEGIDSFEAESAPLDWGFESQLPGPRYFSPMAPIITKRSILFEYEYNRNSSLAGWTCEYCLGRVVCIDTVSDLEGMKDPVLEKILKRSVEWTSEERGGLLL